MACGSKGKQSMNRMKLIGLLQLAGHLRSFAFNKFTSAAAGPQINLKWWNGMRVSHSIHQFKFDCGVKAAGSVNSFLNPFLPSSLHSFHSFRFRNGWKWNDFINKQMNLIEEWKKDSESYNPSHLIAMNFILQFMH